MTTHVAKAGTFSKRSTYPRPNQGVVVSKTFGHINLANVDGYDNLRFRRFKGRPVQVDVGGLIHEGRPSEQLLTGDEYPTLLTGKFKSFDINRERIDLDVGMDSGELTALFPKAVYEEGESKGLAKPFMVGHVDGYQPRKIRPGRGQFHDGLVDTQDTVADEVQVAYTGYGINFYPNIEFQDGYTKDSSGFATYDQNDHTFTLENETTAAISGVINGSFEVRGDGVRLESHGNALTLYQDAAANRTAFDASGFIWSLKSPTKAVSVGDYPVTVTVDGALEIDQVGGRWFKFIDTSGGSTGGAVTINFGVVVGEFQLIIRQQNLSGIDNPSIPYDSLEPLDGSTDTWVATFESLNSSTFSFDFESPTVNDWVAVWFQKVEFVHANPVEITIKLSREIAYLALAAFTNAGSLGFTGFSIKPNITPPAGGGKDIMIFDEAGFDELKFTYLSGFGSAYFYFQEMREEESFYGVRRNGELITLKPPPISLASYEGAPTGVKFRIAGDSDNPPASNFLFGSNFRVMGRARLKAQTIPSAKALIGVGPISYDVATVTPEWRDFVIDVNIPPNGIEQPFEFYTFRGITTTKGGLLSASNSDVDFDIELEMFSVFPLERDKSSISLYDASSSEYHRLLTYRVADTSTFSQLPPGLCLYDDQGFVQYAESYDRVEGDFVGYKADPTSIEGFREVSERATGTDHITAAFSGELVGFVMDQQKAWIEHVATECYGLDYVIDENDTTQGVTIERRRRLDDVTVDFHLTKDDVVPGSINRSDGDAREYRYIIEYAKHHSDGSKSKHSKSRFGYTGENPELLISTSLRLKSDAENRDEAIVTDSTENEISPCTLVGIGRGLKVGMLGVIDDPEIPPRSRCLIIDLDESDDGHTYLIIKIYRP